MCVYMYYISYCEYNSLSCSDVCTYVQQKVPSQAPKIRAAKPKQHQWKEKKGTYKQFNQ